MARHIPGNLIKHKTMENKVYQMVTDRIIEQMQKGIIPWRKPWHGAEATGEDVAISYTSRRAYSTINQFLLGNKPGEWLTFKQLTERGGKIKKGAKAGIVVFYGKFTYTKETKQDGAEVTVMEEHTIPVLKYYNVFHIEDCTGIESKIKDNQPETTVESIEQAESIINAYVERETLKFQNDKPSNRAYYSPSTDEVVVPMLSQYTEVEEYYSTLFHELTHSTGIKSRCDRGLEEHAAFGSAVYSREELVAEMGSAMVCNAIGISTEKAFRNSVAYLQSWIDALKSDKRMIVWAAGRAEKAVRYMFGEVTEKEVEE